MLKRSFLLFSEKLPHIRGRFKRTADSSQVIPSGLHFTEYQRRIQETCPEVLPLCHAFNRVSSQYSASVTRQALAWAILARNESINLEEQKNVLVRVLAQTPLPLCYIRAVALEAHAQSARAPKDMSLEIVNGILLHVLEEAIIFAGSAAETSEISALLKSYQSVGFHGQLEELMFLSLAKSVLVR